MSSMGHGNPHSYKIGDLYDDDINVIIDFIDTLVGATGWSDGRVLIAQYSIERLTRAMNKNYTDQDPVV